MFTMPEYKNAHLTQANREVIEDGLREGQSASRIAAKINVSKSTVTREVKANRTCRLPDRRNLRHASLCVHYKECMHVCDVCGKCNMRDQKCRYCRTKDCTAECADFKPIECEFTSRWPYVCTDACHKGSNCPLPKFSYRAAGADAASRTRLSSARTGIDIDPESLGKMVATVKKLLSQGQSPEAIWAEHSDELPVGIRTFYNYVNMGVMGMSNMDLPRKVRYKQRKHDNGSPKESRIDRTGRTYADFLELSLDERVMVAQADTVLGFESNRQRILSLHLVAASFQFYLLHDGTSASTVAAFDALETYLGSVEAFRAVFGIVLADRGSEFNDFAGMERSVLADGEKRCRVFYCDPMRSCQKGACEKNHEELRKILPKGRSDFDALSAVDVAVLCSHVNSYPRPGRRGARPYDLAEPMVPKELIENLGIERVAADEVMMSPKLLPHAITIW